MMHLSDLLTQDFVSLFWIMLAAVLAAVAASATRRVVPDVVWMLIFGMAIGQYGLGLATEAGGVGLLKELGLGFLFLLAGTHIKHDTLTGRRGMSAFGTWGASILVAFGVMYILLQGHGDRVVTAIAFAIALTSTALGTILPILTDSGETKSNLGKAFIVHGAVGEFGPIVSMSLLLSSRSTFSSAAVIGLFIAITIFAVVAPARVLRRIPVVPKLIIDGTRTTSSTAIRMVFLLLTALLAISAILDLDIVLGAFAAGIIVRAMVPDEVMERLESMLSTIGYSFLIPTFFVCSGMGIDWHTLTSAPVRIAGIVAMILMLRGGPIFLAEALGMTGSGLTQWSDKVRLAMFSSAGLPIIVAVTGVAESNDLLSSEMASIMVLGGAITVLLFPAIAKALGGHKVQSLSASVAEANRDLEREAEIRRRIESEARLNESKRRSRFSFRRRPKHAITDARYTRRGKKD